MRRHRRRDGILAVRPDGLGDVLLTGPAVRALAASGREVSFLAGPAGTGAAALLPGVSRVLAETLPWIDPEPAAVEPGRMRRLLRAVRRLRAAEAVIFTSFHQSPLPTALVLRMAGVRRISAISEDYPGSLLDVRHQLTADIPEARRNLSLAQAAGFRLPAGDPGTLAVTRPLPDARPLTGDGRYIVLHAGASVPARHPSTARTAAMIAALVTAGHRVVLTGSAAERELAGPAPAGPRPEAPGPGKPGPARPDRVVNLCGRTSLPLLASVLAGAGVVIAPNTGAAHLAAAVGTPVVSLFAPVVPAARWAPYGVPTVLLGDQDAPCARSRARSCPVPGHPCLDRIEPSAVVAAVAALTPTVAVRATPPPTRLASTGLASTGLAPAAPDRAGPGRAPRGETSVAGALG
ncbi:MAG: ADP-heptose:LPS heptosyltransferase [Actinomycetia bacterium]|nr:ADP-heptose:LPS heptosyltransferase [Actinomycetes bacterium]